MSESILPVLRSAFRRPLGRLMLVVVLLAGALCGYVLSRGGWANLLRLPPTLDASTPRTQDGFTLLDLQLPGHRRDHYQQPFTGFQYGGVDYQSRDWTADRDKENAFGAWIKPPLLPHVSRINGEIDSQHDTRGDFFSVTARLSTGEVLPLEWHLRSGAVDWPQPPETVKRLMFVSLPTGYSNACRFVDLTVSDKSGQAARWRIRRLPRMRHAVPRPSSFTTTVTEDGVTMSALAWHPWHGQTDGQLTYILHPLLPPHSHQWDVVTTEQSREWEPFGSDGQAQVYATSGTPIVGRNGVFNTDRERWYGGGIVGFAGTDFYPRMTRFLRLTTELRQFETYDERVTFHNVAVRYDADDYRLDHEKTYFFELPRPLSVVTPSGITVTLPAQGKRFKPTLSGGDLNFLVTVRPTIQEPPVARPLPNSPLARTFGKPITLNLTFPPPYESSGWSYEQNGVPASYAMRLPANPARLRALKNLPTPPMHKDLPPVLENFTLIVHQRVDLRTIPMTFTLPVADAAPAYYPKGYKVPKRP